eukprot:CAMPEP_0179072868 /NCGR_PEP_ID=MMETSP0796-20121207/32277_1 /TAXON_ID=73915 /ORGANISM="Pyrodinium bahamense, Strain pbaha01" /LENGTH=230 /DNA_ID=CAMNT_0020770043 /DNA_START=14 /DNA_END=706 /DNA_ORIENTATION=+
MGCRVGFCCMCSAPPVAGNRPEAVRAALNALNRAYCGHANVTVDVPHGADARAELEEAVGLWEWQDPTIYGELAPLGLAQILHEVGAQAGQRFCDLGSGTGKMVALAWLLGLDATGVEIVEERVQAANAALGRLRGEVCDEDRPGVRFIHASFLDFDFSEADIVYTWDIAFTLPMKEAMAATARRMRRGASVVSSVGLPGPGLSEARIFLCGDWAKEIFWGGMAIQTVTG